MRPTRREFLTIGGLATAAALLAACTSPDPIGRAQAAILGGDEVPPWSQADAATWRALGRLTFGPRPDEIARATELGVETWIEEQLAPEGIPDREADLRVRRFDTLTLDPAALAEVRDENARRELQSSTLLRAVYSKRQLREVMVDFWGDHFSISTLKGECAWLKTIDDREVIRPHALGRFRDLLVASMHSPAMLFYLDNQVNRAGKPNENYARELLELHTLGVGAGYSQGDVQEVARCLTGWTIDRHRRRGRFAFDAARHDAGPKILLGVPIPAGGGVRDGERVAELLLAHPVTPRFIARKLARRFVADDPLPALVAAVADTFARTDGDIKATLRTLFRAPEFTAAPPKFKRPFAYIAGALRQLGAATDGGQPLLDLLARMGQPLFQWPTPDGFPDRTAAWSAALLARWRFALALATDTIPGTRLDLDGLARAAGATTLPAWLDRVATLLLGTPLPAAARDALLPLLGPADDDTARRAILAIILASPGYQWR
jgi:uncharacterized protein (DUF1800 family)